MIAVVGWPRSGTHWMKAMLESTLGEEFAHDHSCPGVEGIQYVLLVRDPRDAFASHWRLYQKDYPGQSTELGFIDLFLKGGMESHHNWNIGWVPHTRKLLEWNERHTSSASLVRYEQMYATPEKVLEEVLARLGRRDVSKGRIAEAVRETQGRRCDPSDLKADSDMGRPGKWRAQLRDSTVRALIEYCGSEMVELGYLSREERAKWRRA